MYCEKCGKKLNPGERCSCENGGARSSVERSDKEKKNRIEKIPKKTEMKKSGGNIYIIISLLLLVLGGEIFWYFQSGTDDFFEQIPVAFVTEYKNYFSYGILIILFLTGIVCGIIAYRKKGVKTLAITVSLLNFSACILMCVLFGSGIYQRYEVLKICNGEWTEASLKKVSEVYSKAAWDDPLKTDIQDAVLKKIDSIQIQYEQETMDYKLASSQLQTMSELSFAAEEAESTQNYVEKMEREREKSDNNSNNEPESQMITEPAVTEKTTEKVTEMATEAVTETATEATETETEYVTEKATEKSETEQNVNDKEADAEKEIDAILNQADYLIEKGDIDQARATLLQAYNITKNDKIQEKLDELILWSASVESENFEVNEETEKSNVFQSGIHRYEYCLLDGTWEDAYRACLAKGGHLVVFETQEEFDYVTQDLNDKNQQNYIFFLGGRRNLDSHQYYWVDETNSLKVGNCLTDDGWTSGCWLQGEPSFEDTNLGLQEHVLSMFYYDDLGKWVWNDVPNNLIEAISSYSGKVGYICEYEE